METLHAYGHAVHYHDLYAEGFDPILPSGEMQEGAVLGPVVAQHCDEIANADGIIVVHPNSWGQPPVVLKGWIDRMIRPGLASWPSLAIRRRRCGGAVSSTCVA